MILQTLTRYYEELLALGKIDAPGWAPARISFALYLDASESIQQRAAMVLRDVHYVIDAHFEMTPAAAPGDNHGKFQDIIKRRLERGQCYSMPYLGTREFPAHFRRCAELPLCPDELKGTKNLGWMLWDKWHYVAPREGRVD